MERRFSSRRSNRQERGSSRRAGSPADPDAQPVPAGSETKQEGRSTCRRHTAARQRGGPGRHRHAPWLPPSGSRPCRTAPARLENPAGRRWRRLWPGGALRPSRV